MRFRLSMILTLFRTEVRMVLRDRRAIFTSIFLPVLIMPLMLFSSQWSMKKREQKLDSRIYSCVVTGPRAASVRELLVKTHQRLVARTEKSKFQFQMVSVENPMLALTNGEVDLVLVGTTPPAVKPKKSSSSKREGPTHEVVQFGRHAGERVIGEFDVRILFRANRDESVTALTKLSEALRETRRVQQGDVLKTRGFGLSQAEVTPITETNLASQSQVSGLMLGRNLTLLLLFFVFVGGSVVATDLLAGEKERGTLETLLTTSAARSEIIVAKHLVVLVVALVITLMQSASLFAYATLHVIPLPPAITGAITPLTALQLVVLYLPMAALIASALLFASGYAKSYKEAQLYFFPVFILGLLPALAAFLPGLDLRSAIVCLPIANTALSVKQLLVGNPDWLMIGIGWLVTTAAAAGVTLLTVRSLSAEKLITSSEADSVEFTGGFPLFERRVLRWFALLWAVTLGIANYMTSLNIRVELPINLIVLLFGTSVLMIRRYKLNFRSAFSLRMPRPIVWPVILVAAPSAMIAGVGLFRLAAFIFPVSSKMLEAFGQNIVPPEIPMVELLFFLALMPAIFEELAFRGVLLHGLHRRFHPVIVALIVGLVFGMYHVALFRLAPTAFLGILLAAVTMLTGSIYPAMLWHALNNAAGVFFYRQQVSLTELAPLEYVAAAGILACSGWILWRSRTVYPGLRTADRPATCN